MILKAFILLSALLFVACGGDANKTIINKVAVSGRDVNTTKPIKKIEKSVTIYIHGYDKDGYKRDGAYGEINQDEVVDNLAQITDFATMQNFDENDTNILAVATYYGNLAPSYYSEEDIQEIDEITKAYGGGIPRYATIIAKFAKHVMQVTKADNLNIVSASMGSLVSRWIIEKDIEHLASSKKIKKWISIEGVIRGNYAASNSVLMDMVDPFMKQHIDSKHMDYDWVKRNLDGFSAINSNYKDIKMSFISSTHDKTGGLDTFLAINGQLQPNDGVQLVKDTVFQTTPYNNPTYTIFHQDHLGIKDDKGAWADIATILSSKKRVKITLLSATVSDLHEHIRKYFNKYAEIVFQSSVKSPKVYEKYGIDDDISERLVNGGTLNLVKYKHTNREREINQVIFNDYVFSDEAELNIKVAGFELDKVLIYGVREFSLKSSKSSLGTANLYIPLDQNQTIDVYADDWSGKVKVEIF